MYDILIIFVWTPSTPPALFLRELVIVTISWGVIGIKNIE